MSNLQFDEEVLRRFHYYQGKIRVKDLDLKAVRKVAPKTNNPSEI